MISSIALGTSIVLYDGSPTVPDYYRLWNLADEIGYEHQYLNIKKSRRLFDLYTYIHMCRLRIYTRDKNQFSSYVYTYSSYIKIMAQI